MSNRNAPDSCSDPAISNPWDEDEGSECPECGADLVVYKRPNYRLVYCTICDFEAESDNHDI